ncbi:hypothetical protein COU95_03470 [Candidatus Shapirobacteria bacterium CG10_big_fil_rev_8_21_14_0_10_40_9]|uniref:Uncharacterized protein n=1 Tax=Candidatus Shapirobacteria bacterium CG10_big_fil_rev_8_21_14_0_10_40_9 TaxID=1974888 RepID=A0A2M8L2U7_9BACT|nr:MAG: hypothetical protein COU95_03470 [Candidatus Shapirobacteria bacterium CG10_big_fil_rev_8_21_14_0_10_40_9]
MKKYLPIIGIFIGALILFGALFWFIRGRQAPSGPGQPTPTPTPLALEERPYVTLTPRSDGHELKLEIENLKDVQTVEYELVYFAGDVSRGVIGSVDLKSENSLSRDLLLGTCSKNVCKYDEGVTEGTLTLRFRGVSGAQKYEVAFRLQTGKEAKVGLSSGDGNFTFQGSLPSSTFYLTQGTLGLPKKPSGKVIGGPYGIFTLGSASAKGTVKLKITETSPEVKILGWDGSSWKEYSKGFETDGEVVSVEVDRLNTFVAVSP